MKKIIALVLTVLTFYVSNAQWIDPGNNGTGNIYYTNGNVGIGTSNPESNMHISSETSGDAVLTIEADTDNNNESDNPIIEFKQDGGQVGAYIGFDETNFGGNIFGIGRRYTGIDYWNLLSINTLNGNIGIGTSNPQVNFHVSSGTGGNARLRIEADTDNNEEADNPMLEFKQDGGLVGAYFGFDNNNFGHNILGIGTRYQGNDTWNIMAINTQNGNVGIGKQTPIAKLHVNGNIIAEEIKVEAVSGADFVFDADYNLMPLAQIEAYIKQNQHLPEVPSAAEMEANGVELGKMNMLLLQKIEELTLHAIAQEERIKKLEELIKKND